MRSLLLVLALGACTPKVPAHLAIDPPKTADTEAAITDLTSAIDALVRKDPLARAPKLPSTEVLAAIEGGEGLVEYVQRVRLLEKGDGQVERELRQLEDKWSGTAVVALTRGYRLRLVENMVATTPELNEAGQAQVAVLLTPLQDASPDDTLPLAPLHWLEGRDPLVEQIRRVGDRWVLAGWMASPEIPLEPVGRSLDNPIYDGLTETPMGKLVVARANGASADPGTGYADLKEATRLALLRAAADRDSEQATWSEARAAAAEATGAEDPIAAYLDRAAKALTAAAGDDKAAGGALLALGAQRWVDACPDTPCIGVDRTSWMRAAGRWHEGIAPLAATWRVIALKEALDDMDVGHETVLYPQASLTLTDALLGTGAGPLELSLLRRRSPTPQVWLELARAVGTEGSTDWTETRVALGNHLERQTLEALEDIEDPALREPLERISKRAVP